MSTAEAAVVSFICPQSWSGGLGYGLMLRRMPSLLRSAAEFCYLGAGDQGVVDAKGAVLVPQGGHEPRSKSPKLGEGLVQNLTH